MKPKVGLALGAGGARGLAHIGVIQVLEEHNIPVDMVAGSSMGSLVGALYAMGHDGEILARFAQLCREKFIYDFTVSKMGFLQGKKIKEVLYLLTQRKRIEDLPLPLTIVATDLKSGEKVLFREGLVADAVRASISIPGIFVPVKMNDRLLVDGSVVDRVPVSVVKEMGADIIIAVDISTLKTNIEVHSIVDVMLQSIDIMQHEMVRFHELNADIVIRPKVNDYSWRSFEYVSELIQLGREATKNQLANIQKTIASWKEKEIIHEENG